MHISFVCWLLLSLYHCMCVCLCVCLQVLMGQMQFVHSIVKFNSKDSTEIKFIHTIARIHTHAKFRSQHMKQTHTHTHANLFISQFPFMAAGFAITVFDVAVVVAAAAVITYYSQMFNFNLMFISKFYQKLKIIFAHTHSLTHKAPH